MLAVVQHYGIARDRFSHRPTGLVTVILNGALRGTGPRATGLVTVILNKTLRGTGPRATGDLHRDREVSPTPCAGQVFPPRYGARDGYDYSIRGGDNDET